MNFQANLKPALGLVLLTIGADLVFLFFGLNLFVIENQLLVNALYVFLALAFLYLCFSYGQRAGVLRLRRDQVVLNALARGDERIRQEKLTYRRQDGWIIALMGIAPWVLLSLICLVIELIAPAAASGLNSVLRLLLSPYMGVLVLFEYVPAILCAAMFFVCVPFYALGFAIAPRTVKKEADALKAAKEKAQQKP